MSGIQIMFTIVMGLTFIVGPLVLAGSVLFEILEDRKRIRLKKAAEAKE